MLILNGKQVAQAHRAILREKVESFTQKFERPPGLAVVIVGEDPASHVYVRNKERACADVGIRSFRFDLPQNVSQVVLDAKVEELNKNPLVDGILVQFPLPQGLSQDRVLELLEAEKDADGLTFLNLGYLWAGRKSVKPCTPFGVMEILKFYQIPIAGKHAVVVGRSHIVGKPMAQLLLEADATVTVCHSRTTDLEEMTRQGDIVIVAAGRPKLLGRNAFKAGAVVVDVGIHRQEEGLCGDVRWSELEGHVAAVTPVPGGVGPMTITMLLENTLELAQKRMAGE